MQQEEVSERPRVPAGTSSARGRRDRLWMWIWGDTAGVIKAETRPLKSFVLFQLVAILALGILTITSFEIWAPIDERGHFEYVQTVADDHRLPTLDPHRDLGHNRGTHTYEAFQPPLYYVVAAPLLKLTHVRHTRILILRSFGLVLVFCALFALWRVVLMIYPTRPVMPFAFGAIFFLLPGVVVRSITISYQPLATLIAIVFVGLALKADRAPKGQATPWLLGAAIILALGILTNLFLASLAGVYAVVAVRRLWLERRWRTVVVLGGAAAIVVLLVSPWLAFNEAHYQSLTANNIARNMQQPLINPTEHDSTIGEAPSIARQYAIDFVLPNEWGVFTRTDKTIEPVVWGLDCVFVVLPFLIAVAAPRVLLEGSAGVLALPFVFNFAFAEATTITANWPTFGRYLYGGGAAWFVFACAALRLWLQSRAALVALLVFGTIGAGYLWVAAGSRYF